MCFCGQQNILVVRCEVGVCGMVWCVRDPKNRKARGHFSGANHAACTSSIAKTKQLLRTFSSIYNSQYSSHPQVLRCGHIYSDDLRWIRADVDVFFVCVNNSPRCLRQRYHIIVKHTYYTAYRRVLPMEMLYRGALAVSNVSPNVDAIVRRRNPSGTTRSTLGYYPTACMLRIM